MIVKDLLSAVYSKTLNAGEKLYSAMPGRSSTTRAAQSIFATCKANPLKTAGFITLVGATTTAVLNRHRIGSPMPFLKKTLEKTAAKISEYMSAKSEPEAAKGELAKAESDEPEAAKGELAKAESDEPEAAKGELAKAESDELEAAKGKLAKAESELKATKSMLEATKGELAKAERKLVSANKKLNDTKEQHEELVNSIRETAELAKMTKTGAAEQRKIIESFEKLIDPEVKK